MPGAHSAHPICTALALQQNPPRQAPVAHVPATVVLVLRQGEPAGRGTAAVAVGSSCMLGVAVAQAVDRGKEAVGEAEWHWLPLRELVAQ